MLKTALGKGSTTQTKIDDEVKGGEKKPAKKVKKKLSAIDDI